MDAKQKEIFEKEYLPYIVKVGRITSWVSIPLIFLPAVALMLFYGAEPSVSAIATGFIGLFSSMVAWYIVDPVTLYPILHIPGMYMTYIAGNSKEIRAPAATAALSATDVEAGTEEGTVISAIAIATSVFVSLAVMTAVAIAGNFILSLLPAAVLKALNYLLPALFGAMCMQRVLLDHKTALVLLPVACVLRYLNTLGAFKALPLGGGYAQILLCVIFGVAVSRYVHRDKLKEK